MAENDGPQMSNDAPTPQPNILAPTSAERFRFGGDRGQEIFHAASSAEIERLTGNFNSLNEEMKRFQQSMSVAMGPGTERFFDHQLTRIGNIANEEERTTRAVKERTGLHKESAKQTEIQRKAEEEMNKLFNKGTDAVTQRMRTYGIMVGQQKQVSEALKTNTNPALQEQAKRQITEHFRRQASATNLSPQQRMQEQLYEERKVQAEQEVSRISDSPDRLIQRLADVGLTQHGRANFSYLDEQGNAQREDRPLSELQKVLKEDTATSERVQAALINKISSTGDAIKSNTFSLTEVIQSIRAGNVGGALAEFTQPFGTGRVAGALPRLGRRLQSTGFGLRTGEGGMLSRSGGSILEGLGSVLETTNPIGLALAAINAPRLIEGAWGQTIGRVTNMINEQRRAGMVTGEGFGAGVHVGIESRMLGMNPFDLVSTEMARQIIMGIREQGFRGKVADAMAGAIVDGVNKTGLDPQLLTSLMIPAVTQGRESIQQFSQEIENLRQTAQTAGISMQQAAQNLQNSQQYILGIGGTAQQANVFASTIAQATRGIRLPRDVGMHAAQQLVQNMGQMATMRAGRAPFMMASFMGRHPQQFFGNIDTMLNQLRSQKPAWMDMTDYATVLAQNHPYFQGMDTGQVLAILRGGPHAFGRGAVAGISQNILANAQLARDRATRRLAPVTTIHAAGRGAYVTTHASVSDKRADFLEQQAYTQSIRRQMHAEGYSNAAINQSLHALTQHLKHSTANQNETRHFQQVLIKFTPDAARYFTAVNAPYTASLRGRHNPADVTNPP